MLCPLTALAYFSSFFCYTEAMLKGFFDSSNTLLINSHPLYQNSNGVTNFLCNFPGLMPATLFQKTPSYNFMSYAKVSHWSLIYKTF